MIIDSRNRDKHGRTVVPEGAALRARLASEARLAHLQRKAQAKAKARPKVVPGVTFDHKPPAPTTEYPILQHQPVVDPRTWSAYSKDANYSISGLGSTRRFKRYPGKQFPMAAAVWRESPASAERAAKDAKRNLANDNKTASGAVKSL